MNTPAHLIIGAAMFARPHAWAVNVAAVTGSLLPDASLYFMFFWNRFVRGIDPEVIFRDLYYSDFWQQVFAIDNSFFLWGGALLFAIALRSAVGIAFAGAGFLHLTLDFPLHHDDGRAHFWPVSDWIFESPVSYWDPNAHGGIFSVFEIALCIALLTLLWRRFSGNFARSATLLVGLLQVAPALVFGLMLGE